MRRNSCVFLTVTLLFFTLIPRGSASTQAGYAVLHQFTSGSEDGANLRGDLTLSGDTLYGLTFEGVGRILVPYSK